MVVGIAFKSYNDVHACVQAPKAQQYGEEDEKASAQTAAILQAAEVHSGHDALKVLYEAAAAKYVRANTPIPGAEVLH